MKTDLFEFPDVDFSCNTFFDGMIRALLYTSSSCISFFFAVDDNYDNAKEKKKTSLFIFMDRGKALFGL